MLHKIDMFWNSLREFTFRNRTLFEILFICVYALEQLILVLAIEVFNPQRTVSLFAIIVLSTFALHKLMMESRIKLLEQQLNDIERETALFKGNLQKEIFSLLSEDESKGIKGE